MSKKKRRPAKKISRSKPTTDKYKTDKYVEYIFIAELSILNADALSSNLTDGEVVAEVKKLIGHIRKTKKLPYYKEQPTGTEGLIAWLIVENWNDIFDHKRKLSQKEMIGCLEVVAESAETRMRKPNQRKYLNYLKKFMKRAGVSVEALEAAFEADEADDEIFYDLDGMSLAEVGSLWLEEPNIWGIEDAFENKGHEQITGGQAKAVATLCQELLPLTGDPYIQTILYTVQGQACRRLGQIDQAIELLTTAREMNADYFGSRHELAEIYYEQENYESAIQAWQECLVGDRLDTYVYHQIAEAYRQMGDLTGEEQTWRELLKVQERRGCLTFLVKVWWRYQNFTTLANLADCLERQGKTAELNQVLAQIDRSRPHPQDTLSDWAYWVRYRLERSQDAGRVLNTLQGNGPLMLHPIWSDLLQACVYDWLEQPQQAAPFWQKVNQEVPAPRRTGLLSDVHQILGPVLPLSSRLFALVQKRSSSGIEGAFYEQPY